MPLERHTLYDDGLVRVIHVRGEGEIAEHAHNGEVEVVLVIDGKAVVKCNGEELLLVPFTLTRIEPGAKHSAQVSGEVIAIFIKEDAFTPGEGSG